jgi:hypothetical protein
MATDCETKLCDAGGLCAVPHSCAEITDGRDDEVVTIDPDGDLEQAPFDVRCLHSKGGGGWTLAIVAAHDNVDTWTWTNGSLWTDTTTVGDIATPGNDMKSAAAFSVPFRDLLFVHDPSDTWAAYHDVGDGSQTFIEFMEALGPPPICDPPAGSGYAMAEGTLEASAQTIDDPILWDTDLYFNRGDQDRTGECAMLDGSSNDASWGPTWNAWVFGDPAPSGVDDFNDPFSAGFGPRNPLCDGCSAGEGEAEYGGLGFAAAIGYTEEGPNFLDGSSIRMYVR